MNTCKSFFPKWIIIIFFFQFIVFVIISLKSKDNSLIYWSILPIFLGVVLLCINLTVSYNDDYIEFKFSIFPKKKIYFNEIDNIRVVKKNDFLGYGISVTKVYGKAFILESKEIVCITKKNGKKITLSICNSIDLINKIDNLK